MRETVEAASVVCRVVNTRCPVSAADSAIRAVSGSRISPDDDHVRRLPQRCPQRGREVRRIDADLYLLDHAAVVRMLVFDRIFNGHDMPRLLLVDLVDQRGKSRSLARARRSADDHQPALQLQRVPATPAGKMKFDSAQALSMAAPGPSPQPVRARDAG